MCFGSARSPLDYGLGLTVGDGKVVPEVKYLLKPGLERDIRLLSQEYKSVTLSVLERALALGVGDVQLETEFVEPLVLNEGWSETVAAIQKAELTKYNSEHGIRTALRATIADVRRFREGLRGGEHFDGMISSFEGAAKGGADLLSIESRGGQEVFSYSLIRNDLGGILFALGVLAPRDVRFLWRRIAQVRGTIPAGDTACALANSAMVLAGGLSGRRLSHVLAAVVRAMSAVRTLACYEEGAKGPGKDCAYENAIVKAVTGYPMSMEGKTSAFAHSSLVGNIAASVCDLWSNETIVVDDAFGGKTPAVIFEMLSYDAAVMNQSIREGSRAFLRDLYVNSDAHRDPQALVLSPVNAVRIGKAIVSSRTDYERAVAAGLEAVRIIEEASSKLLLPAAELKYLSSLKAFLSNAPTEDSLTAEASHRIGPKVQDFRASNYAL